MPEESNEQTTQEQQTEQTPESTSTETTTENTVDDLSKLFTPEEVTAKKEAVEASKAEETRRAALTDAERAAEDAKKSEDAKLNEVPEAYEFKVPEGMELDKEVADEITPLFKDLNLSQSNADKLVQVYTDKMLPMFAKRQQDAWQKETDGWKDAVAKDPEIGGNKFKQSVSDAQRTLNTIGTPEKFTNGTT